MPLEISEEKIAELTRKQPGSLWGQVCEIEPAFVRAHLGDGLKLVAITPLSTRPDYYLIRVDSRWSVYNSDEQSIGEHIDEIYDAIEEEFGRHIEYDDDNKEVERPWPALNLDCGSSWCDSMDLLNKKAA